MAQKSFIKTLAIHKNIARHVTIFLIPLPALSERLALQGFVSVSPPHPWMKTTTWLTLLNSTLTPLLITLPQWLERSFRRRHLLCSHLKPCQAYSGLPHARPSSLTSTETTLLQLPEALIGWLLVGHSQASPPPGTTFQGSPSRTDSHILIDDVGRTLASSLHC